MRKEFVRALCFGLVLLAINLAYVAADPDDDEFYKSSTLVKSFVYAFDHSIGILERKIIGIDNSEGAVERLIAALHGGTPEVSSTVDYPIIFGALLIFWSGFYLCASFAVRALRRWRPIGSR
jgi:hypothetical protein